MSGSRSNRRRTANCRRSSGRCRCCRRRIGPGAISRRRRSTRRSAAAPTRSNRSTPAARSPIAGFADYWAADLPVMKGRYNVDTIRYDYYRDATIALEAFKAGQFDVKLENSSKDWATGYDSPALRAGLIKKEEIPNELPSGMQGFALQSAPAVVPGPAGARGAGLCLRFRMVEQEFVLRRLQAHAQLFRQFRTGGDRGAAGRGTEDPRKVPRTDPRRRYSRPNTTRRNTTVPATSATACARR